MKKIGVIFLILGLLLVSCDENSILKLDKRPKREKKTLRKTELVETAAPDNGIVASEEPVVFTEERVVHVTYTTVATDSSYWYVIMKDDNTNWHGTVSLATPYFDFNEAKKEFEGAVGKGYFKFILQISKESVPSFYTYND